MALELEDRWVWDFWIAVDGETYHLFFLQAPRSLRDPELRHRAASVGHATSTDLIDWTDAGTAITPGLPGEWDDVATWTGSVIHHADRWWMFYSGSMNTEGGLVQRIGAAVSDDLKLWVKHPSNLLLSAHPFWYEQLDRKKWHDEAWRDPWVYPVHDGYEMLVTARVNAGPGRERGVIGRAFSADLTVWTAIPPLTLPGDFGQMEVPQLLDYEGRQYVLFSCDKDHLAPSREPGPSDTFVIELDGSGPPYSSTRARALDLPNLYGVRAVQDPSGEWVVLGFEQETEEGKFSGRIVDPIPLSSVLG